MVNTNNNPKISVVTPSFNQGKYLEATIISVLGQSYPNLEYIIMDGGSTDNSLEIIKKYADRLFYWESQKDGGQSNAINKGFQKSTGDILMWLNSDDLLLPGAFSVIVNKIDLNAFGIYFGNCIHFKNDLSLLSYGSNVVEKHQDWLLENHDYIIQPSTFWTRCTWQLVGELNEEMNYAFDWEWFLRAKRKDVPFVALSECLSLYRIHENHKTGTGGGKRNEELAAIYKTFCSSNETLFYNLIEDRFFFDNKFIQLLKIGTDMFYHPVSETKILKLIKYKRYKAYTNDTITQVKGMILPN